MFVIIIKQNTGEQFEIITQDGVYNIKFIVRDLANNTTNITKQLLVDTTPPVITYTNNNYTTAIMPNTSPLNTDKTVADQWLRERYHPDRIWKMPDEKVIAEYQKVAEQQRTYILQQFHSETSRGVQAAPPPPMTNSPATSSSNRPRCYALDWRDPKTLQQPTKCITCPVDIPCSEEVKQKIAAGIQLPTEQTPMR
jgi:hypothetical protein